MSTGKGLGDKDEIPSGEQELVRQIVEAASSDSTEVGAKIRSLDTGLVSSPSESSSKEPPYDIEKDREFSKRMTELRHRYVGLPKHFAQTYERQFKQIFKDIEKCHGNRDYEEATKLLPVLKRQIETAENLMNDRERHSVESRKRRLAARDIPEKWLGAVNSLFQQLEKCLEASDFGATHDLFDKLDKAISQAGRDWIDDLHVRVEKDLESVKVDAPIDCVKQLDELNEQANRLREAGEFADAAATLEELVDYLQFVADEKLRIAEEARERLLREAEESERRRQFHIKQNTRQIEELIKEYEGYASLLAGVSTKAASTLEDLVKKCKEEASKLDLESEGAGTRLVDLLAEQLGEELGDEFYYVIDDLEKYKSVILSSIVIGSKDQARINLSKTWNTIKQAIEDGEYSEALESFGEMGVLLGKVEGEETYKSLFTEVESQCEDIRNDSDAWMPTRIEEDLEEAEEFKNDGKYSKGSALLRRIKSTIPKVESVTLRYRAIKGAYETSQNSKATKEQKKAIQSLLEKAKTEAQNGEFSKALSQLDLLESKIQEVASITDRRTDPDKFPKIVAKASKGGGMTDLNTVANKLTEGGMTAEEVMKLIPSGTKQNWKTNPSEPDRYKSGFKYEWQDNQGNQYHIHGHSKDSHHDETTNSGAGAVVRIRINNQWLRSDGTLTEVLFDDKAHIPLY